MTDTFTLAGRILDKSKQPVARAKLVLSSNTAVLRDPDTDEIYAPPPRVTTNDQGFLCVADASGAPIVSTGVPLVVGVQYTLRGTNERLIGRLTFTAPAAGETLNIADVVSEPPANDPSWSDALADLYLRIGDLETGGGDSFDDAAAQAEFEGALA